MSHPKRSPAPTTAGTSRKPFLKVPGPKPSRTLLRAYGRLIGLRAADPLSLHESVKAGFELASLDRLQHALGLSQTEVIQLVQIPKRTLARRRREGRLRPAESDRLLRVTRVFHQAVTLFDGDTGEARAWLSRPQRVLGGRIPLALATTEVGAQEVERALLRIEHGVFA
jgi:putative toxin-antitoxin system antitoxin component (TIGR02293 family)